MKKILSIIMFFLLVVSAYSQEINKLVIEKCLYPTIMIMDKENQSGGTGFLMRSTKVGEKFRNSVLTAEHIVQSNGPFFVKILKYKNLSEVESETIYPLYIYALNEKHDFAIGVFESKEKLQTLDLDFEHKISMGSSIFHVGFGMMDDARIDFGHITQTKTYYPEALRGLIRTNAYCMVGDSGGPLLLTNNLKAIGVCRVIRKHKEQLMNHQSYFTDIKMLQEWDKELNNGLEPLYTEKRNMPILPFIKMDLQNFRFKLPN